MEPEDGNSPSFRNSPPLEEQELESSLLSISRPLPEQKKYTHAAICSQLP